MINLSREAYRVARDASDYSLVALSRAAVPLMTEGGSIVAMILKRNLLPD